MTKYEPVDNFVLLEVTKPEEEIVGGVIIPDSAQETSAVGLVRARGPLVYEAIQVGARVLFQPYLVETELTEDGQRLVLVLDSNIYAVISESVIAELPRDYGREGK